MCQLVPDVIILELGSNNLVELSPQTVGSELESLVRELYEIDSVQFVVVGQVLRRHTPNSVEYNCKVGKLHQYLKVVLEPLPFCYYWRHRGNLFCCVLKRHFLSSKKKKQAIAFTWLLRKVSFLSCSGMFRWRLTNLLRASTWPKPETAPKKSLAPRVNCLTQRRELLKEFRKPSCSLGFSLRCCL